MKVALSTIGKFHIFDLARQLHRRGHLTAVFSGYPRFKLGGEAIPPELIRTFPFVHTPYMALRGRGMLGPAVARWWERADAASFAGYVARNVPSCDIYMGLSGSTLAAGRRARSLGARYICDRGSSHIRTQDQLLREELARWGEADREVVDPRTIEIEEMEYEVADCITVPSGFVYDSFIKRGIPAHKLRKLPYGVDLSRFTPVGRPDKERFDVLFVGAMSLRKGVHYLADAFIKVSHPAKSLTFVGTVDELLIRSMQERKLWPVEARAIGHVPQSDLKAIMSRSHVMVLPSIEEGLALVLGQAMACGCPVIASDHTGAGDLVTNGRDGYIVPIRNADALAEKMQGLADDPDLRDDLGRNALQRVQGVGGWSDYGDNAVRLFQDLLANSRSV